MTQPIKAYEWLLDNPVGAHIVVQDRVADNFMLNTGGMMYRDDLWHSIRWERMSPGTGNLRLVVTPYKSRIGAGPRVYLSNPDTSGPA